VNAVKISVVPENPMEWLLIALRIPPAPLADTHLSVMRTRTIMVGTKLGVFDVLAKKPLPAAEVAKQCCTSPRATEKLLNALVGSDYLEFSQGDYRLSAVTRKWLTSDSPLSVRDKVLLEFLECAWVEHFEDFVRTGKSLDIHQGITDDQWGAYQRGMRVLGGLDASEITRRTPVPKGATSMLDIGGSHGFYSVSFCRRYPRLNAVILDLPSAVKHAAPILAKEGMGARVVHRPGDALKDDLGTGAWDFVFVSRLVHHFDEATNRDFIARIARALKPGGLLAILDMIRPNKPGAGGQFGSLLDLYFALTSQSGTWSVSEISSWQRDAGLLVRKPIFLRSMPGAAEVLATKPR
jgi:SAM-dependent methyltransferase